MKSLTSADGTVIAYEEQGRSGSLARLPQRPGHPWARHWPMTTLASWAMKPPLQSSEPPGVSPRASDVRVSQLSVHG